MMISISKTRLEVKLSLDSALWAAPACLQYWSPASDNGGLVDNGGGGGERWRRGGAWCDNMEIRTEFM